MICLKLNACRGRNRKFRNSYIGDWNDKPFEDFSQERFKKSYKIPHERGRHYAEDNRNSSHQRLADYADETNFPHQREKHCPVEMRLSHQREEHYADEINLPLQREELYADERHLPHRREEHYADEMHLPHQRENHYADEINLPLQREEHYTDERHLPRQREEHYADERNLPHHREHYADEKHLPRYTGDRHLLRQREEHYADERHLPSQREEHYADERNLPHQREKHYADERHLPRYADDMHLPRQWEDHYSDESHIPNQTSEDYADKKTLPRQRLKSTISDVAPVQCPQSNNGKRHRMLLELREPSKKTSNGQESRKIPKAQINPVLPKSKKNWCSLENVSYEARIIKLEIVPDQRYKRKVRDYNSAMDHGFSRDIRGDGERKYMKKKVGITSLMKSSKYEVSALSNSGSNRTKSMRTDFVVPQVPVTSLELSPPPAVRSSIEPKNHIDSQREVQKHGMEKNDAQHAISMEFNAPPGFELPPSALLDNDAISEVSANTETKDGSSQGEVEMDVLTAESENTNLPQACVCLTCGDKGFEDTLVYCSKCKGCALHSADSDEGGKNLSEVCDARGGEHTSKECDAVVDSEPIATSIWKGTLKLFNKNFELMCHLSTSACRKVHEKTSQLPDVLNADLLERSTVLPESFRRCGTSNHSIDLYFFPQDER
ncbi:hypothetical protein MtrunA17_Chr6g0467431 [Medicago truncatula]|uniref:AIPP2-like SPOC-like domain-containing protein n=1 Tax=Medicago truncatula TaxID=3880 RepID=A0A396HDD4_MEDTR|nr:hypothetical protein MtrunA17_Chr6g0467431 [Medicago truncatula]